jgi:GTP-binding protein
VAFSGRSNVGKSSLINRLLGRTRHRVARISATPGKTQEINFYRVRAALPEGAETEFYLVDLPGYGYARVPAELRRRWKPLIEGYLSGTPELRGVVQLLDARHGATALDLQMVEMLAELGLPTLFVLTKIDKLGRAERRRCIEAATKRLGVGAEQVVAFSAETGEGRELLLESLAALLFEPEPGGPT